MKRQKPLPLYDRVRDIIEAARAGVTRSVDTAQVASNWLIGREIVEDEQHGKAKAEYGRKLVAELSEKLRKDYGAGYSATNLKLFRQFYFTYPQLLTGKIGHALRDQNQEHGRDGGPGRAREGARGNRVVSACVGTRQIGPRDSCPLRVWNAFSISSL